MTKPIKVHVYWSENGSFKDGKNYKYEEFEFKCRVAAKSVTMGYDKTKIKVFFDDGTEYSCRLDLSMQCDKGFKDHCLAFLRWYERQEFNDLELETAYFDNYEFIKRIEWNDK